MTYIVQNPVPSFSVADADLATLRAQDGATAVKVEDGTTMVHSGGAWAPASSGAAPANITLKNSDGTITRTLALVAGVATLAATDTITGNGTPISVVNSASADAHSSTATVAAGVLTNTKFAATVAMVDNGDTIVLQNSTGAVSTTVPTLNSPATAAVSAGVVSAVKASA